MAVQAATPDAEALAATRARLAVLEAKAAAAGSKGDGDTAAEAMTFESRSVVVVQVRRGRTLWAGAAGLAGWLHCGFSNASFPCGALASVPLPHSCFARRAL